MRIEKGETYLVVFFLMALMALLFWIQGVWLIFAIPLGILLAPLFISLGLRVMMMLGMAKGAIDRHIEFLSVVIFLIALAMVIIF